MDYEIVRREAVEAAGLRVRASNTPEGMAKIGATWGAFFAAALPEGADKTTYGVYTAYENGADGAYDMLACRPVKGGEPLPEGFSRVTLPAGRYARFAFRGDARKDTGRFWRIVWNTPLPRKFDCDFEEYAPCDDPENAPIILWIGLADEG